LTLDGNIVARGLNGAATSEYYYVRGGGGSGGSIWLTVGELSGSGRILCDGGNGYASDSGGGAGGRIAVYYQTNSFAGTMSACGGSGCQYGAAGTIYLSGPEGDKLIYDNNGHSGANTPWEWKGTTPDEISVSGGARLDVGASTPLNADGDVVIGGGTIIANALNVARNMRVSATSEFADTLPVSIGPGVPEPGKGNLTIDAKATFNGTLYASGGLAVSSTGHLITSTDDAVALAYNAVINGKAELAGPLRVGGDLTIGDGGRLHHRESTAAKEYRLDVTARKVLVEATGAIDVTGRGYVGSGGDGNSTSYGKTIGNTEGSYYRSGGGYCGLGGQYGTDYRNPTYGNPFDPNDPGSGGGGDTPRSLGGDGGGLVRLVAQELVLDGDILANGADGAKGTTTASHAGGGSGGGIYIKVHSISASGRITANGGNGYGTQGCGGGAGRVAVFCDAVSSLTAIVEAKGGTGYAKGEDCIPVISRPWYVDADAPNDPSPCDPLVSDPLEDGSGEHPFDTIEKGLAAAPPGERVVVRDAACAYTGLGNRDIEFPDKSLYLVSESGPSKCIIDCQGSALEPHRAFHVAVGAATEVVIGGFTITGGYADGNGGAALLETGKITIRNCVIRNNTATGDGGGIFCRAPNAAIENNTIARNNANGYGGGWCSASRIDTNGVRNCIFWQNSAGVAGPQIALKKESGLSILTVAWSNAAGGTGAVHVGAGCMPAVWMNNIDAEPLFFDPDNGDYHLRSRWGRWDPTAEGWVADPLSCDPNSPCIDAGDPASFCCDEPQKNGGQINMGAYGGTREASKSGWYIHGDVNADCAVNLLDLITCRNRLNCQAGSEPDCWKSDVNGDCRVNLLDLLWIRNRIGGKCTCPPEQ